MMKHGWPVMWWLLLLAVGPLAAALPTVLTVYFEESHAGSFYWLAEELALDEPHALVLIDAHSDASGVFDSDRLREGLRRVASVEERARRLAQWREHGAVQCFNWIEPLMPRPFARVAWATARPEHEIARGTREAIAREQIDGHTEAMPRACGLLAEHFHARGLETIPAWLEEGSEPLPVVVSLDLDAFAGLPAAEQEEAVRHVFDAILQLPRLRAVTLSLSRPWLRGEEEADRLGRLAMEQVLRVDNAALRFEPYATTGPDRSEMAKEMARRGQPVPRFELAKIGPAWRSLLVAERDRLMVRHDATRWTEQLDEWDLAAGRWRLEVEGFQEGTDGMVNVPAPAEPWLRVIGWSGAGPALAVRWLVWEAEAPAANVMRGWTGPGFAAAAPAWIRRRARELVRTAEEAPLAWAKLRAAFDSSTGWGTARVQAEVTTRDGVWLTPPLSLRRLAESRPSPPLPEPVTTPSPDFRAALSGHFARPYVFGSTWLEEGDRTGPETGWGADCANFLIAGLRESGRPMPWGDPRHFRRALEPLAERLTLATRPTLPLDAADVARGVIIDLGSHVAALFEDRPPVGELDGADLVAHQLEGPPQLLPLETLLRGRRPEFSVWRVPVPAVHARLVVSGDVMPGRTIADRLRRGEAPLAGLVPLLGAADAAVVNLEGALVSPELPAAEFPAKRHRFHAPPAETIAMLHGTGLDAASLANNHSGDAGKAGRRVTRAALGEAGLKVVEHEEFILLPVKDLTVALVGVNFIETEPPSRERLAAVLRRARQEAHAVIILPHWGEEYTGHVTAAQREWARWFIARGAAAVIGGHPHHRQFADYFAGRPVVYSLGNLVFDEAGPNAGFRHGWLAEFGFAANGTVVETRLHSVRLDERGFPQLWTGPPGGPEEGR